MANTSKYFPDMPRVSQITNSHCGPAVLSMLLSFVGVDIDQDEFVKAVGAEDKLEEYGLTVGEMMKAVSLVAPEFKFWYRDHGTREELSYIINEKKYPIGIEWQGLFYEYEDDDNGHYAVAVGIDIPENKIIIADPFKPFSNKDRIFKLHKFLKRWWDVNEITNPATGKVTHEADDQMMFIITPKDETFPLDLSMNSSEN